jgi:hypothetical protein
MQILIFLLVFRIAKGWHQDLSLLCIIILVIHHFFGTTMAPLVCFHPLPNEDMN